MTAPLEIPSTDVQRRAARIVVSTRGGPIRLIVTGKKRHPTGLWYSDKCDRSMPWESRAERDLCIVADADTAVVRYLVQPHRLEIDVGEASPLVYIPDAEHVLASGATEIIEVKLKGQKFDAEYKRKLDLAAGIYRGLGWVFRELRDTEIRRQPRLANSRRIVGDGAAVVSSDRVITVIAMFSDRGQSTYGSLRDLLGGGPAGEARLHALVVRRILALDLERRLRDDSPVRLVPGNPDVRRVP